MLKIFGIILISSAVSMYGILCSKKVKEASGTKEEIASFIGEIEKGITFGRCRLYETINTYSSPLLEKDGFLDSLRKGFSGEDRLFYYPESLTQEEKNKLSYFLCNIGKSRFSEKEILLCKEFRLYFEEAAAKSSKDAEIKSDLYKKIGIICAIGCAVIFL